MPSHQFRSSLQAAAVAVAMTLNSPQPSLAAGLQTESIQPKALTLDALVAEVLQNNPELAFYRAEIAVARGEQRTAVTRANPDLSASIGEKRIAAPVLSDGLVWSASITQTFEWPGRIPLRKAIADQQIKLAELGLDQFRAALASRSRVLAFNLFAAQEAASAAREVADRFKALREVLVQRDPAGLTPVLETRIIEATELTLQRRATEAALAQESARLELNQLRGQPWEGPLTIEPPSLPFPPFPGTEPLLASARTHNFEIRIREAELEQQGFKVSLAKNEKKPTVTVGPYVSQERAGDRETQVGVSLVVPLSLWNKNDGKVATEEARRLQAETALTVAHRNLERQVIETAFAYQKRLNEMARWRPDSVRKFQEAAALADRHYRLGAVPIATYVELQKQYLDAVDALLSTRREALAAAQELQRLTGVDLSQIPASNETPRP
ncbi:MAG: TolC family protein [Vicinamibacteria bacterium]|nr:TolC family protein [Vicinamibacteria bacterium]